MTPPIARILVLFAAVAISLGTAAPADAQRPLRTGFLDPHHFTLTPGTFEKARATGATQVRLALYWVSVANGARPANARQWDDPAYNWGWFDEQVRKARANGLTPVVTIQEAPAWATGSGTGHIFRPSPADLADFTHAAAVRYSGTKTPAGAASPLPAVRHWQIWNEPNRRYFLQPQVENGRIVGADWYREMVRIAGAAIRGVDARNKVVAGGLAPMGRREHPAPLPFMRTLLCLSPQLKRTCDLRKNPVRLDIWAHHPYTSGGPTRKSASKNDVMISGLPAMRKTLRAAIRLGHVRGRGGVAFWATEFGWDTKPPDPKAVPMNIHARWTSEALYRMWKAGVSSVIWWRVQDDPMDPVSGTPYQSGFYFVSGKQKKTLTAFRFPVVAFRTKAGIQVWGRTPHGTRGQVQLYVKSGGAWRPLGRLRTNAAGIFSRTYGAPYRSGAVKATFRRESSLPFSLTPVKDRYVNPMGCGGRVAC